MSDGDLSLHRDAPDGLETMVRSVRLSRLKDGDMLIFSSDLFGRPKDFQDAACFLMRETKHRFGVELSEVILIARPGHADDIFVIDEKQLNEHGYFRRSPF